MNKIICIGSSTKDIFFPIVDGLLMETPEDLEAQKKVAFELGAKYQLADNRRESIGGCAANVACGLARLGINSFCCTRIGNDYSGEWIKKELIKNGVKTDLIQEDDTCQSDFSFILDHLPSKDRIIFSDRNANEKLEIFPKEIKKIEAEWIFVSSLNGNNDEIWENKMDKILQIVQEENIKLIFNPGQKNIKKDPQKVVEVVNQSQLLIVNKDEAIEIILGFENISGEQLNDEKFLLKKLVEYGSKIVILTDGKRGAWSFFENDFFYVDALANDPKETTGSGDAFTSGFIGAYLKEKTIQECLQWGAINSASVVGYFGAIEGLLSEREISRKIADILVKKI